MMARPVPPPDVQARRAPRRTAAGSSAWAAAWLTVLALVLGPVARAPGQAPAAADDAAARAAEQSRLAAGADLSPRAQTILERARAARDAGRWEDAVGLLQGWLQDDPGREHHLLRLELGACRAAAGDTTAALADLQAAVELEPRFGPAWLALGELAYRSSRFAAAGEAFRNGYALLPDPRPEILHYAGVSLLLAGEADEAAQTLGDLLRAHRAGAPLQWYQALVAAALESAGPQAARPFLDNLLADRPDTAAAWELASQFDAACGDYRAAAIMLTIAGYLQPLRPDQWLQLAELHAACDVPLQAARCYQRVLSAQDAGAAAVLDRAAVYERLSAAWLAAHRPDEARRALDAGLAEAPTPRLWSLLGDLRYGQGEYEPALAAFARACELDPQDGRSWLMAGHCALALDRPQQARTFLGRAAESAECADAAAAALRELER